MKSLITVTGMALQVRTYPRRASLPMPDSDMNRRLHVKKAIASFTYHDPWHYLANRTFLTILIS